MINKNYLSLVLFLLVACCSPKSEKFNLNKDTIVEEGLGFNQFQIGRLTKDSIIKYFGKSFKEIYHDRYIFLIKKIKKQQ